MSQTETLIEEAIQFAKSKGIKIVRGAIFNRSIEPINCNALGAILIKLGKEDLVNNGFSKDWMKYICDYLGEQPFWIWRFVSGFDYGNQLILTHAKQNDVEEEEKDKISRYGDKLANRVCK